jgi:hypothetical protein
MGRDPDAEHHNIDDCDNAGRYPFDPNHQISVFGDNIDSVDDDLHQQLNFEYPAEQQSKEYRYTVHITSVMFI